MEYILYGCLRRGRPGPKGPLPDKYPGRNPDQYPDQGPELDPKGNPVRVPGTIPQVSDDDAVETPPPEHFELPPCIDLPGAMPLFEVF